MKKIYALLCVAFFVLFCMPIEARADINVNKGNSDSINLYDDKEEVVQVFSFKDKSILITDDDLYLMAQIVYAESRAEPFNGKVAVASVILNRLQHPDFPKTVEGVVKQKGAFSCVLNGEINVIPNAECYNAVNEALKGKDPTNKAVFFYNPKIATSKWMKNVAKNNVVPIGNHVFFVVKR